MKINVKKLQVGGYLQYTPTPIIPQQNPYPQSQEETPKSKTVDKDIMETMLGKGITSDVYNFADERNAMFQEYENLPDDIKNSSIGTNLKRRMTDYGKLNEIIRNKERLDSLVKDKQQALDDVAVYQGKVFVADTNTGELNLMNIQDYSNEHS